MRKLRSAGLQGLLLLWICGGAAPFEQLDATPLGAGVRLGNGPAKENSGIVRSRQWPDVYWMINDSGDEPRVYPVRRDGSIVGSDRYGETPGCLVGDAINVDWEDICVDSSGRLIVPDVGNNENDRRDLVLYYLSEPAPSAGRSSVLKKIFIRYPNQPAIPAPKEDFNYDCEAVFTLGDKVHLLTKHRSDTRTKLYRVDRAELGEVNDLTLIGEFAVEGQATAADALPDGSRLIVATYTDLWLFEITDPAAPLSGPVRRIPFTGAEQIEAACFVDATTALVADEVTGRLFEVALPQRR